MDIGNVRIEKALRTVCKVFPEAELVKPDGSREKLSAILVLAADVKSVKRFHVSSKIINQQLSLDFWDCFKGQQGGGT